MDSSEDLGLSNEGKGKMAGNEFVDLDKALGYEFKSNEFSYTKQRVIHYALAIGAGAEARNGDDLPFVYELNRGGFHVFPTFAVIYPFGAMEQITYVPGLKFNFMNLLHGEQYLEVKRPLPTEGTVTNKAHISQIYDKGSGAVVIIDVHSMNAQGEEIAFNQASVFIRGIGGFGGERGPSGRVNLPPERKPDAVISEQTSRNQALHYRIASGDPNPLHADPGFAAMVGFKQPILHGLCTFGFAGRAVLRQFGENDPARFKSMKCRFSRHVFPGETILTEMWQEADERILFQSRVVERDEVVLSNGAVELHGD